MAIAYLLESLFFYRQFDGTALETNSESMIRGR
jgi:hypothetical protein